MKFQICSEEKIVHQYNRINSQVVFLQFTAFMNYSVFTSILQRFVEDNERKQQKKMQKKSRANNFSEEGSEINPL